MTEIPQEAVEAFWDNCGYCLADDGGDTVDAEAGMAAALPFLRSQWEQERAADRSAGWTEAEYMASPDLASRLHGRILDLLFALAAIRDYDSFQGGPIAPRATPTENALRRIATDALEAT